MLQRRQESLHLSIGDVVQIKCDERYRTGVSRLLHDVGIVRKVFQPSMSIYVITEQGILIIQKGYTGPTLNATRPLAMNIGKYQTYGVGNEPVLSDILCRLKKEIMGVKDVMGQWMKKQTNVAFTALHKKTYASPQQGKKLSDNVSVPGPKLFGLA